MASRGFVVGKRIRMRSGELGKVIAVRGPALDVQLDSGATCTCLLSEATAA
jgi:hypothetical protein